MLLDSRYIYPLLRPYTRNRSVRRVTLQGDSAYVLQIPVLGNTRAASRCRLLVPAAYPVETCSALKRSHTAHLQLTRSSSNLSQASFKLLPPSSTLLHPLNIPSTSPSTSSTRSTSRSHVSRCPATLVTCARKWASWLWATDLSISANQS